MNPNRDCLHHLQSSTKKGTYESINASYGFLNDFKLVSTPSCLSAFLFCRILNLATPCAEWLDWPGVRKTWHSKSGASKTSAHLQHADVFKWPPCSGKQPQICLQPQFCEKNIRYQAVDASAASATWANRVRVRPAGSLPFLLGSQANSSPAPSWCSEPVIWSRACPFRPHFLDPGISNNFHVTNNVAKAVANHSEQSCVGQKCLHEWIHHLYPEHVILLQIKQSDVHQLESRWRNFLLLFCLVLLTLWKATKTWEAYHLPIWPCAKSSVYIHIQSCSYIYDIVTCLLMLAAKVSRLRGMSKFTILRWTGEFTSPGLGSRRLGSLQMLSSLSWF